MTEESSIAFRRALVMTAGICTTLATLILFGAVDGFDLLRSYSSVFGLPLPTGALALGLLAGSGYGIAGWRLTDLKFTPGMLKAVGVSMVLAYIVLIVIEYSNYGPDRVGFFEYFDQATRHSALVTELPTGEVVTSELGPGGYSYRLLELGALVFGGLAGCAIIPLFRRALDRSAGSER